MIMSYYNYLFIQQNVPLMATNNKNNANAKTQQQLCATKENPAGLAKDARVRSRGLKESRHDEVLKRRQQTITRTLIFGNQSKKTHAFIGPYPDVASATKETGSSFTISRSSFPLTTKGQPSDPPIFQLLCDQSPVKRKKAKNCQSP
jgi:hypothetical protein